MAVDPSRFHLLNVADTCAVWNVLSSPLLYAVARDAGCGFCLTSFVHYECLVKRRRKGSDHDTELQRRLRTRLGATEIQTYSIDIDDLQDIMALENRKRVSKGELSSIAFARKTRQAFLTDDQGARRLANDVMDLGMVQTTPHLFGWLFFHSKLTDGDKDTVIAEHKGLGGPLEKYFEEMYATAIAYRLMATQPIPLSD